jgi:hypothetical protein
MILSFHGDYVWLWPEKILLKIMIQIKLIGMSMISYYTKVHLSKCNGS